MWGKSDEDGCGGERGKGRRKRGWMDSVNVDFREKGLSGGGDAKLGNVSDIQTSDRDVGEDTMEDETI